MGTEDRPLSQIEWLSLVVAAGVLTLGVGLAAFLLIGVVSRVALALPRLVRRLRGRPLYLTRRQRLRQGMGYRKSAPRRPGFSPPKNPVDNSP